MRGQQWVTVVALAALATAPVYLPRDTPRGDAKSLAAPEAPAAFNPMLGLGMLSGLGAAARDPGPFGEPTLAGGSGAYHAIIELSGAIVELSSVDWLELSGGADTTELRTITDRLHALGADAEVKSLLVRAGDLTISPAAAEELRAAIATVVAAKPVHCHMESADTLDYVALSTCSSLTLAPAGSLLLAGPMAMPVHLKRLLDTLHVEADFLHMGAYKGAAEPLTRTEPSPEMRETYEAILDGVYERFVVAITRGGKLDRARAVLAIDTALHGDVDALAAGLVDAIADPAAWRAARAGAEPWRNVKLGTGTQDLAGIMRVLGLAPKPRVSGAHVALLYAVGEVVDGDGSGPLGARSEIASGPLSAALRAAADDDTVKAIVLRVDSPGGSALASEAIWHAAKYAGDKKPVVVSMGELAASGGYYISCGAKKIFAQPDTLTGSIGVVGGKIVLGGALAALGIDVTEISRGQRAGLFSVTRRWSADERAAVGAWMGAVYKTFTARVAQGRKLSAAAVEKVAQGRVWIGADAKRHGLVDALGGLDDALAEARKLGGLPEDAKVDVYPAEPTLLDLVGGFAGEVSAGPALSTVALKSVWADANLLLGARAANSLAASLRSLMRFRTEAVRVVIFPALIR